MPERQRSKGNYSMLRVYRRRGELPNIIDQITETYQDESLPLHHLGETPLPSEGAVISILNRLRSIIFPGYFGREHVGPTSVAYYVGELVYECHEMLSDEIFKAFQACREEISEDPQLCQDKAEEASVQLLQKIPALRRLLASDARAAMSGDPAAKSIDEVIFSYPYMMAITIYRVAHELYSLGVPLIPRIMTEYAHRETGIDIHPGADIGESFFIDHGTGVVIGETTDIGNNVKIYQGVTLGALSFKEGAERMRGRKRHPTIGDNVVIYSGATILGGETVIGEGSIIGGNVWIISSVPPRSKVMIEDPKLRIQVNH